MLYLDQPWLGSPSWCCAIATRVLELGYLSVGVCWTLTHRYIVPVIETMFRSLSKSQIGYAVVALLATRAHNDDHERDVRGVPTARMGPRTSPHIFAIHDYRVAAKFSLWSFQKLGKVEVAAAIKQPFVLSVQLHL